VSFKNTSKKTLLWLPLVCFLFTVGFLFYSGNDSHVPVGFIFAMLSGMLTVAVSFIGLIVN